MWGFGKKSKHSLKSTDATNKVKGPSKADASTTAPRFQSPGTPFVAPMDPYALYFSIPVNCAGDFNDALKRFSRRHPPCVDSVTNRRGQPHKVYIRKNFMILRNLLAFLTGGQQYVHKGFRIRDLYYVRRTLINLLLEPQRGAGMDPENPAGSVMESASTVELSPLATPDAEVIEVVDDDDSQSDAVKGDGTFESKYIIEDERATDLYGSIRRALLTNQTQQLQSVGHYVSNMAFSAPPGLLEFTAWLEALFASRITAGREEAAGGMISFDSLEHIYKPGDFIYGCHEETGTSYIGLRVTKAEYRILRSDFGTSRSFRVEAECIVATGNDSFVNCSHHFTKGEFLGRRSIDTLEWRPMTSAIRELLIMRGRKYVELSNGHHFMAYASSGFSIHRHSTGHVARSAFLRTTGRVMIDNSTAVRLGHFPCNSFSTWGFSGSVVGALKLASQQADLADQAQLNQYNAYHGQNNNNANNAAFSKIPISFLPLTYPAVAGFSFTSKTWGHCLVDAISEIKFNERAFDQLVMAPSRKALIRALVIHTNDLFADIIQGKGSSTVFLLHGPPGSGKTLSAESIAESLHKPLYSITMGELGVTPQMLEERIQEVLQLASLWGCLVLIDEADIVVERRNTKDLKRNALVGILLRQLEYFNGVLFLTSNRVSVFDEAVHSRVTIALKYKALSRKSRLDVWRVLLDAAGVTDIDPTPLAEYRMNGRQIKNAIRLGEALAKAHGESLSLSHLQHTIAVSKEFLDLLHESNGDQVEEERESDHEDDDRLTRVFAPSSSSMLPEEMTGDDWNDDMMKLKRPPL